MDERKDSSVVSFGIPLLNPPLLYLTHFPLLSLGLLVRRRCTDIRRAAKWYRRRVGCPRPWTEWPG